MGLDFTTIKDQPGAAVYFIHDGSEQGRMEFEKLMADVSRKTRKQCVLMAIDEPNGDGIVRFYQLKGSHHVVIVRDDDQLHHSWSSGDEFDASEIAYLAEQAG